MGRALEKQCTVSRPDGHWDREVAKRRQKPVRLRSALKGGRKRALIVLFVASAERDGTTPIDQDRWDDAAFTIREFTEE
jgi:hypothetical protein